MKVHKQGKKFYARVGDFFGTTEDTPQLALAALDRELEGFHPLHNSYIRAQDGTVLHVFQVPSAGWSIRAINMLGIEVKWPKGRKAAGYQTNREAVEAARQLAEDLFQGAE